MKVEEKRRQETEEERSVYVCAYGKELLCRDRSERQDMIRGNLYSVHDTTRAHFEVL